MSVFFRCRRSFWFHIIFLLYLFGHGNRSVCSLIFFAASLQSAPFPITRGVQQGCPGLLLLLDCAFYLLPHFLSETPRYSRFLITRLWQCCGILVCETFLSCLTMQLYVLFSYLLSPYRTFLCQYKTLEIPRFQFWREPLHTTSCFPFESEVRILGVVFTCAGVFPSTWEDILVRAERDISSLSRFRLSYADKANLIKFITSFERIFCCSSKCADPGGFCASCSFLCVFLLLEGAQE